MYPPRPVPVHLPVPPEEVMELCRQHLLERAAQVLGLPAGPLRHLTRDLGAADGYALTAATARLLAAKIGLLEPVCPSCAGTDRELPCARELGTLDVRLTFAADRAVHGVADVIARRAHRPPAAAPAQRVVYRPGAPTAVPGGLRPVCVTRHSLCRERRRQGAADVPNPSSRR